MEEQGGWDFIQSSKFPSFDVAQCDKLLKLDLQVHNTIISSKKVVEERKSDEAEAMLASLFGCQSLIDQLVKGNVERYQLRLRVDAQQQAKVSKKDERKRERKKQKKGKERKIKHAHFDNLLKIEQILLVSVEALV